MVAASLTRDGRWQLVGGNIETAKLVKLNKKISYSYSSTSISCCVIETLKVHASLRTTYTYHPSTPDAT